MRKIRTAILLILFLILTITPLPLPLFAVNSGGDIVIMLDPGHSEMDGGGTYAGDHRECWYNMKVALACKAALEAHGGFKVYLSHPDNNTAASLLERAMEADRVNADMILSIHFDGSTTKSLNGASAMISVLPEFSLGDLASMFLENLSADTGIGIRGVYSRSDTGDGEHLYYWNRKYQWDIPDDKKAGPLSDYYGIISWGAKFGIPAVIVEHGFLTNPSDRALAEDENNLRLMGIADANAIIEYYTNHTHKWEASRTDYPTSCCFRGKASQHCSICKARRNTVYLASAPNDNHYYYISSRTYPTCTRNGYTVYTCRYAANLTDKGYDVGSHEYKVTAYRLGHKYEVTEYREVTHTTDGIRTQVCTRCGDTKTEITPAEGHSFVTLEDTLPTCTADGSYSRRCTVCGETVTVNRPSPGHSYTVTADRPVTCTADGIHTEVCSVCGDTVTELIPAAGHSMKVTEHSEPTCTTAGLHVERCSECGEEVRELTAPLGHSWDEGRFLREPTPFREARVLYVCTRDPAHTREVTLPRTMGKGAVLGRITLFGCTVIALPVCASAIMRLVRRRRDRRRLV